MIRIPLLAAILLGIAAAASAAVKNRDTFVLARNVDVQSLDPAFTYGGGDDAIIRNIYEYLVAFQGSGVAIGDLVPQLGETVPSRANGLISPDGLVYRFPIRKGVKFHDGSVLTPEDVRYSLLRFMLSDTDTGPASLLLQPILGLDSTRRDGKLIPGVGERAFKAVTVEGDSVVVRLDKPFSPFLLILAGHGAVMNEKWCAAHGQWDGALETWERFNNPRLQDAIPNSLADGTGPFRLARFDPGGRQIVLARFDGYWRGPARLKNVVIKIVEDFNTRRLMLQAGDADVISAMRVHSPLLQGIAGVRLIDGLPLIKRTALFFTFKMDPSVNPNVGSGKLDGKGVPPDFFADKDVRQAFAFSIDFDAYVRDVLRGQGAQDAGMIPPPLLGARTGPPRCRFDPKLAAEHFKKAWGGKVWEKGFAFSVPYLTGTVDHLALYQMLKKNVESLNPRFHIELRPIMNSTAADYSRAHKRPFFVGNWGADYPDPHNFAFPIFASAGSYPESQDYADPELDRLIQEALTTTDEAARAALYGRIQDAADEELPNVPLANGFEYRAQRTWVKGFVFNPMSPGLPENSYYYDLSKAE